MHENGLLLELTHNYCVNRLMRLVTGNKIDSEYN